MKRFQTPSFLYLPDVIWSSSEGILPISCLPESEAFHLGPVITHRRVAVYMAVQVDVYELLHVDTNNLIYSGMSYEVSR